MRRVVSVTFALLLLASAAAADAQVIERPRRSTGGLFGGRQPDDPNKTRQELAMSVDFLGGYDDNISPDGGGSTPDPLQPRRSGTTATIAGGLDYRRGKLTRNIEANVRTVMASYRGIGVDPMIGARGTLRGFARLFDKTTVTGWAEGDYQPTFMFGSFTPEGPDSAAPPVDPTGGVVELKTVNASGGGSLVQAWTARHDTNVSQGYARTRSTGLGQLDSENLTTVVGHSWRFVRNVSMEGSYTHSKQSSGNVEFGDRPLTTDTASLGLELRVPISRTRRMTFSGNAGATHVQTFSSLDNTTPIDYTTPAGYGSVRLDVGRTWAVSADLSRSVQMLEGLTLQSFVTTAASLWTGGTIGSKSNISITGTFADGKPHEGDLGSFRAYGATAQIQYLLSRCCSLVTSYSYYQHDIRDVTAVPVGFPSTFERNTVRVGMSFWLPLFGTFPADRTR
jgi:hypothetical protein